MYRKSGGCGVEAVWELESPHGRVAGCGFGWAEVGREGGMSCEGERIERKNCMGNDIFATWIRGEEKKIWIESICVTASRLSVWTP